MGHVVIGENQVFFYNVFRREKNYEKQHEATFTSLVDCKNNFLDRVIGKNKLLESMVVAATFAQYNNLMFTPSSALQLSHWHKNRVVLLGNACHATQPHLGQSANLAIEDVACLVHQLETVLLENNGSVNQALQNYFKIRSKKTNKMMKQAEYIGKIEMAKTRQGAWARDVLYKGMNKLGLMKLMTSQTLKDNLEHAKLFM